MENLVNGHQAIFEPLKECVREPPWQSLPIPFTHGKLSLVDVIWESITSEDADLPVPEWQIAEIERRSAEMGAPSNPGISWEDMKKWVLNRDYRLR